MTIHRQILYSTKNTPEEKIHRKNVLFTELIIIKNDKPATYRLYYDLWTKTSGLFGKMRLDFTFTVFFFTSCHQNLFVSNRNSFSSVLKMRNFHYSCTRNLLHCSPLSPIRKTRLNCFFEIHPSPVNKVYGKDFFIQQVEVIKWSSMKTPTQ